MKKLISLIVAVVAVMAVVGSAQASPPYPVMMGSGVSAANYDFRYVRPCLGYRGCYRPCDWDVAVAYEKDKVSLSSSNWAKVTVKDASQAISGMNKVYNYGDYSEAYVDTARSYAYTTALTKVNTNTNKVDTSDYVSASNFGFGRWGVDVAVAYSSDDVSAWSKNVAYVDHTATSLAISGANKAYNYGDGCGYCQPYNHQGSCECDPCGDACCDTCGDAGVNIETGVAKAVTVSTVAVNTNTNKVDTGDYVSAHNGGPGFGGVDVAVAVDKDQVSLASNNWAKVKVAASSTADSGENLVKNYGDYANAGIDTGRATAKVNSTVVVNTNTNVVGCGEACGK